MGAIIPVFIPHVGCPHDCVFCNQKKIAGTLCAPTGEQVEEIIREGLSRCGTSSAELAFYGGSFTAIEKPLMEEYLTSVSSFIKSGELSGIRLSTRPDCIDEEILLCLKENGVKTIELGAQSMDDEVLVRAGRGHTAEAVKKASELIRSFGFGLVLQMMTHLPGSNDEKDIATAEELAALSPDGVRVYPTVVVKDTALERLWREGKYIPATPSTAAKLGGKILRVFGEKRIPVIRFGLNPTDDLSGGDALCGAYHPALGEMALGEMYFELCCEELKKQKACGKALEILVNPRRVSVMSGQKKVNKKRLCEKYGFSEVIISGDEKIPDGRVLVRANKGIEKKTDS